MDNWAPEDLEKAIEGDSPVFLKLWKKGCGPCKLSIPAVERLKDSDTHGLRFGQILVDDYPEMMEIAETDVLPAFFVFRDQKIAGQLIGFKGLKSLQELIEKALA